MISYSLKYSNLHTHTSFSDGLHTVEENVLSAIKKNMISIGFSDHSYTEFDLRYCMRPNNIPSYICEVRRIQEKYKSSIEVYLGLECDGFSQIENRELFDYVIGACHYIKIGAQYFSVDHDKTEQWETIEKYFDGDAAAYSKEYFETYVDCMKCNKPDILGHFDLAVKYGYVEEEDIYYRNMAIEALLECRKITPILEVNTGAIVRKLRVVPYPADFLLKEWLLHGGKVILSSDCHDKNNLDAYFQPAVELLKNVGYRSVVRLHGKKFEEVKI